MPPFLPPLLRLLAILGIVLPSFAAEPFLRPHDVIAFVGGEDMVALSEYGYLELLLVRALPDYQLRFRNLAWEGDTVFEQRRDLNFPPLEAQLDKIGATVVIAQFGQMESLAGKEKLPEFIAAYEKLIERFSGGGKRRVALLAPNDFGQYAVKFHEDTVANFTLYDTLLADVRGWSLRANSSLQDTWVKVLGPKEQDVVSYTEAIFNLVEVRDLSRTKFEYLPGLGEGALNLIGSRDGLHLTEIGQRQAANSIAMILSARSPEGPGIYGIDDRGELDAKFLPLIVAKNRLWFNYWRPQNWAFLNGDRINQPSSRDHLDPSKRWFPAEIEEFVPLIEAKEREIDALAAKLAKP